LIIALNTTHPAAEQLANLSKILRALQRAEDVPAPPCLSASFNMSEINHGNKTVTYSIRPGRATSEQAIETYQYIRKNFPFVLDILCHATSRDAAEITVEIGTMANQDKLSYSHHDLLHIMPRILSIFRGTVQSG